MLNRIMDAQGSDTIDADSSNEVGLIIFFVLKKFSKK